MFASLETISVVDNERSMEVLPNLLECMHNSKEHLFTSHAHIEHVEAALQQYTVPYKTSVGGTYVEQLQMSKAT